MLSDVSVLIFVITPIISVLSSVIGSLVAFALTNLRDIRNSKKSVAKERIDSLYVPFYQKSLAGYLSEPHMLDNWSLETASNFLDLFTSNIKYMSTKSQKLYQPFYTAFLKKYMSNDNVSNEEVQQSNLEFKSTFVDIATSLQEDYASLCKLLELEEPIKLF
jgi:hypothetical protein